MQIAVKDPLFSFSENRVPSPSFLFLWLGLTVFVNSGNIFFGHSYLPTLKLNHLFDVCKFMYEPPVRHQKIRHDRNFSLNIQNYVSETGREILSSRICFLIFFFIKKRRKFILRLKIRKSDFLPGSPAKKVT